MPHPSCCLCFPCLFRGSVLFVPGCHPDDPIPLLLLQNLKQYGHCPLVALKQWHEAPFLTWFYLSARLPAESHHPLWDAVPGPNPFH